MQLDIVDVATSLARQTKVQASVAITGAFSDMMRHLRKSIHCCLDDSNLGAEVIQWNRKYRAAVDECLVQLSYKVNFHSTTYLLYVMTYSCAMQNFRSNKSFSVSFSISKQNKIS